jgi:hypothetical protein
MNDNKQKEKLIQKLTKKLEKQQKIKEVSICEKKSLTKPAIFLKIF